MFADRMRDIRKRKKWTQERAAQEIGIARTTYSGYERGTSEPDFSLLEVIAVKFEVDLNWLITGVKKDMSVNDILSEKFSMMDEEDQKQILELMDRLIRD